MRLVPTRARRHAAARSRRGGVAAGVTAAAIVTALAGCGGGGSNPLDNPPVVQNPPVVSGQKLSFVYFQKCINPIFLAELQINQNGAVSTNTCAGSGCHASASGTGGSFRVEPDAQEVDLADAANTPERVRESDMYKNFYSAQGATVIGAPTDSRLLTKPLLLSVLHGGGLIFEDQDDPNAKLIAYWISHPMPEGHDEFSSAGNNLFTPADPDAGTCNTE